MSFKTEYPDFAAIEGHIKSARVERSLFIAQAIAGAVTSVADLFSREDAAAAERKHIAADAFLRRSVQ